MVFRFDGAQRRRPTSGSREAIRRRRSNPVPTTRLRGAESLYQKESQYPIFLEAVITESIGIFRRGSDYYVIE